VSIYASVIFLHIVAALGLFVSIGLEQVTMARLRQVTTTSQAREWLGLLSNLRRIDGPSGLLILVTGFFLAHARWGMNAWIGTALIGMLLMAALSIAVTSRRARALRADVALADAPLPNNLRAGLADPVMRTSATLRAAIGLGIVFDMAVKPAALGAVIEIVVAIVLGAVLALTQSKRGGGGVPSVSEAVRR